MTQNVYADSVPPLRITTMTEQTLHFVRKPPYTRIAKDKVVTLKSAVLDATTDALIEYRSDLTYLHGGYGGAPTKVEQALEGLETGSRCEVTLNPDEGYGGYDPRLLMTLPATELPETAQQVGAAVEGHAEDGKVVMFRVLKNEDGMITLDGNHALAGRTVRFVLEVLALRAATAEELAAGYAFRRVPGGNSN